MNLKQILYLPAMLLAGGISSKILFFRGTWNFARHVYRTA
jgi:hypothetical protein